MSIGGPRDESERSLARALSRHIGYTTGAYDLGRILSVLDFFQDKPSGYKEEIVPYLKSQATDKGDQKITEDYLSEVVNMAQAMRIVETVSSRDVGLQRMAPTEHGRSLLGARATKDEDFINYYITKTVLLADADSLFPVLKYYTITTKDSLQTYFVSFQEGVRRSRMDWLLTAFPQKILLERIVDQVSWVSKTKAPIGEYKVDIPTKNTARHHTAPRQGWLVYLGMLDRDSKTLTAFGFDVLHSLEPSKLYFWLGPTVDAQDSLRIEKSIQAQGPYEDTYNMRSPTLEASENDIKMLIDDVALIMTTGYTAAKLIHAPQASLILSIEYIRYRSYRDNRNYSWQNVLSELFNHKRGEFERLSAHKGQIGFYRPKLQSS